MTQFQLEFVTDRPALGNACVPVCDSVSPSGAGLFLFEKKPAKEKFSGQSEMPLTHEKMVSKRTFKLVVVSGEKVSEITIPNVDLSSQFVDVLPDGRVLLASARCRSVNHMNGLIYDPKSKKTVCFCAGDGIQNMFADNLGRIWISFFDEGIFGETKISASGAVCLNDQGDILWRYKESQGFSSISDCYAMNVCETEAYIYFYTDFPLCKISQKFALEYWETTLSGCHTIAIGENSALFSGEYDDPVSRFYFVQKTNQKLGTAKSVTIVLPDGSPIDEGKILARGPMLHFFNKTGWFRGDIEQIAIH